MSSMFKDVVMGNPIEVFATVARYNEDTHPDKVNLSVGAYRTEEGKPWVLPSVHTAEVQIVSDESLNHEYLPVAGLPALRDNAVKLLLGEDHKVIKENRVCGFQSLGGTGALRIGLDFLQRHIGASIGYVSNPTWGNHKGLLKACGYSEVREYTYWDADNMCLAFEKLMKQFSEAPEGSVLLLHATAHNPTGCDPTKEQWKKIAEVCREKKLFPFFDIAYQGFASGDLDADAWAVRYFADQGFEMFVAQSFSKNFGLYNERTGNLTVIVNDSAVLPKVRSQGELVIRTTYSNPPNHGGRVVATILSNDSLAKEWRQNVKTMADRIKLMRQMLFDKLKALGTPGDWSHIVTQIGMFSYTGLTPPQCELLEKKYHIYLLKSGRINMCGMTTKTVGYVAKAMHEAVTTVK